MASGSAGFPGAGQVVAPAAGCLPAQQALSLARVDPAGVGPGDGPEFGGGAGVGGAPGRVQVISPDGVGCRDVEGLVSRQVAFDCQAYRFGKVADVDVGPARDPPWLASPDERPEVSSVTSGVLHPGWPPEVTLL